MYDIKWIRDNAAAFDAGLASRGAEPLSAQLIALDETRRAAIARAQAAQERRNALSKEIGKAMAAKDMGHEHVFEVFFHRAYELGSVNKQAYREYKLSKLGI